MKRKNSEILKKLRNSEPAEVSGADQIVVLVSILQEPKHKSSYLREVATLVKIPTKRRS